MLLLAVFQLELQMLFWQGKLAEFGWAFPHVAVNITVLWIEALERMTYRGLYSSILNRKQDIAPDKWTITVTNKIQ